MLTELTLVILEIIGLFVAVESMLFDLLMIFELAVGVVGLVYRFRIYRNAAVLFKVKSRILVLWLILPVRTVIFCLFGFGKKYQPAWKVDDAKNGVQEFFSGTQGEMLDQGLTINLNKRTARELLKTKTLLRDVHMEIKPGHMVLLLGGSGAGKTTLLDAVIGYEKADAEIMLNGVNVYEHYQQMLCRW